MQCLCKQATLGNYRDKTNISVAMIEHACFVKYGVSLVCDPRLDFVIPWLGDYHHIA